MRLSLSTPILRNLVHKLNHLDNKVAETIVKADNWIKSKPILRQALGNDIQDDLRLVRPMLNDELIKVVIKECVARESLKMSLPSPGNLQDWLNQHQDTIAEREFKLLMEKAVNQKLKEMKR